MKAGVVAILVAFACAAAGQPARAQLFPPSPPASIAPCMRQMALTTVDGNPNAAILRIGYWTLPLAGDVRVYGHDVMWHATLHNGATAVQPFRPRNALEASVELHAPGPIEGVEFTPSGASCTLHAGLRRPTMFDGEAVQRPIVVATDPAPVAPPSCANPYASVRVVRAAEPVAPPMARQQGIAGDVTVALAVDRTGTVTYEQILSSPSVILNAAGVNSARTSKFSPAVFRCVPVDNGYVFAAAFVSGS
ncbi:MAG TPA: energy transducer TonB [Candidatus Baltobacteraceae bacterium]|nr:energy transducer TonB [Candidatus Baltobacteraceae bacterium]